MLASAAVALTISLLQTPLYQSSSRVLILQKNDGELDAYTLARSSEKLGKNLSTIIGTSIFFNKVVGTGMVASADLPQNETLRRKEWQRILSASNIPDTSILEIKARYPDREKAERMIVAVENILLSQGADFLGLPHEQVFMQVVDAPLTSVRPVTPVLPAQTAAGGLIGLVVAYGYALMREALAVIEKEDRAKGSYVTVVEAVPSVSRAQESSAVDQSRRKTSNVRTVPMAYGMQEQPLSDRIHTMYDDVRAPFGNQYFFENRVIELDEKI